MISMIAGNIHAIGVLDISEPQNFFYSTEMTIIILNAACVMMLTLQPYN